MPPKRTLQIIRTNHYGNMNGTVKSWSLPIRNDPGRFRRPHANVLDWLVPNNLHMGKIRSQIDLTIVIPKCDAPTINMPNCIPKFQWNMQEVPPLAWKTTTNTPPFMVGLSVQRSKCRRRPHLFVNDYNSYKLGH